MKSSFRHLLWVFALGFTATAAWAQTQAGVIKAMKITGSVIRVAADGTRQALTDGTLLSESDTVETGDGSGVVLVFMNGSSVKLGAKSRLAVEEFKMDPLGGDIAVSQLKGEPSVSRTSLNLAYGEMIGDVKKLNSASTYNIKTPVGAAGIRGTTFRIVFTPAPDGKTLTFVLSTSEGTVVFTGTSSTAPVAVSTGAEVVVSAEVNTTTGLISGTQVQSQGISTEAAQQIQVAVTEVIQQAQAAAVFTPQEQSSAPPSSGSSGNSQSNSNSTEKKSDAPPSSETKTTDPVITTPQPLDTSTISRSN